MWKMIEGAELRLRPTGQGLLPREQGDWNNYPTQSRLHGAGLASQASITPENKTGGVISYCREEAMLPASWLSLGPKGGECNRLSSHSGDSGPE